MATDPVCKMTVKPEKAAARAEYRGRTYYFCSSRCHKAFMAAPGRYARESASTGGGKERHSHPSR